MRHTQHWWQLAAVALAAAAASAAPKPSSAPFAPDRTFAQRCATDARGKAVKEGSLVLPHPSVQGSLGRPMILKAGRRPFGGIHADRLIWAVVPLKDEHRVYLLKRPELLKADKGGELVRWCEANGLGECAEFELRRLLGGRRDFQDAVYQQWNRWWLKYADKRQIDWSFPLPVEGHWYVCVDGTKHHRLKHGAAYAFDFIIRRNGSSYKGDPHKLESFYAWDQPVVAQADGVVVVAEDRYEDVPIGRSGGYDRANVVIVNYGAGVRAVYGHIRKGSATVKAGDRVQRGQILAKVGNSGASGLPHLHFSFLDDAHFSIKGRFRFEVLRRRTWKLVDGEDLTEGTTVRNHVLTPFGP